MNVPVEGFEPVTSVGESFMPAIGTVSTVRFAVLLRPLTDAVITMVRVTLTYFVVIGNDRPLYPVEMGTVAGTVATVESEDDRATVAPLGDGAAALSVTDPVGFCWPPITFGASKVMVEIPFGFTMSDADSVAPFPVTEMSTVRAVPLTTLVVTVNVIDG